MQPGNSKAFPMNLRLYRPADARACLSMFDSNVPTYFAPEERSDFERFLREQAVDCAFQVIERDGSIVACGGLSRRGDGSAGFCWGMAARAAPAGTGPRTGACTPAPGRSGSLDQAHHAQHQPAHPGLLCWPGLPSNADRVQWPRRRDRRRGDGAEGLALRPPWIHASRDPTSPRFPQKPTRRLICPPTSRRPSPCWPCTNIDS